MKIYTAQLYYTKDFEAYTKMEYVLAKVEDEILIREIKESYI